MPIEGKKIIFTGKIVPGALRGKPLIDLFYYQITNVVGFEPFEGTLNVKVKEPINLSWFATRTIERVLLDGRKVIDLFIAPVTMVMREEELVELVDVGGKKRDLREQIEELKTRQEQIIQKEKQAEDMLYKEPVMHDCFAIQEREAIDKTVIELIDKASLKEIFGLEEGDLVDVVFYERKPIERDFLGRPKS